MAKRVLDAERTETRPGRIELAFRLALGRLPTDSGAADAWRII